MKSKAPCECAYHQHIQYQVRLAEQLLRLLSVRCSLDHLQANKCLQIERSSKGSKQCKLLTCFTGGGDLTSAFEKDSLIGGTTRGRARPAVCKRVPRLFEDALQQLGMLS